LELACKARTPQRHLVKHASGRLIADPDLTNPNVATFGRVGHPGSYRPPVCFSTARNVMAEATPQQAAFSFRTVGGEIVAASRECSPRHAYSRR